MLPYDSVSSVFASCSATDVDPQAARNEEKMATVLDETIVHCRIRKLGLTFQGDELRGILAASAAPPPPLLRSGRGPPLRVCSSMLAEEEVDDLLHAHLAWGAFAQRSDQPASTFYVFPNSDDDESSPAPSSARDASSFSTSSKDMDAVASNTFRRRQSLAAKGGSACADPLLAMGDMDLAIQQIDASTLQ
ncbi:hypothetical protein T484DRAFT_1756821 [Baffinella frigidus]|nr:hypothetical protein T484DRAFT_1756821 [Cryptophyta sp. CCMP2293]